MPVERLRCQGNGRREYRNPAAAVPLQVPFDPGPAGGREDFGAYGASLSTSPHAGQDVAAEVVDVLGLVAKSDAHEACIGDVEDVEKP